MESMSEVSQLLKRVNQVTEPNHATQRMNAITDIGTCLKLNSERTYETNFKEGFGNKTIATQNILKQN